MIGAWIVGSRKGMKPSAFMPSTSVVAVVGVARQPRRLAALFLELRIASASATTTWVGGVKRHWPVFSM